MLQPLATNPNETTKDKFGRFRAFIGSKTQSKPATKASSDDDHRIKLIRQKAGRFRVLIMGRANAGKTTILQKVCNTAEQPEIFDSEGKKVDTSVVAPNAGRGIHNIENELVFRSNPGFVFHDSRGFEAGGIAELNAVKMFIAERSKTTTLRDQLHVIWYCIPMDDERPFTTAELSFFSECGTGSVPVVAIFTKFDALEDKAYGELEDEGFSHEDAVAQAPARAVTDFENRHLPDLYERKYPPGGHVYLRGDIFVFLSVFTATRVDGWGSEMHKSETDCRELTQTVAAVLGDDNIQRLFVSTQQNNLKLCIEFAVERVLSRAITKMHQPTATIPMDFQQDMLG